MPYSDKQARLIMARAHGAKMTRGGQKMKQSDAKSMMAEVGPAQRSRAMRGRKKRKLSQAMSHPAVAAKMMG
jgi:hypothetical protein